MVESILLVGNSGREHALAWKLSKSRRLQGGKIYFTGAKALMRVK